VAEREGEEGEVGSRGEGWTTEESGRMEPWKQKQKPVSLAQGCLLLLLLHLLLLFLPRPSGGLSVRLQASPEVTLPPRTSSLPPALGLDFPPPPPRPAAASSILRHYTFISNGSARRSKDDSFRPCVSFSSFSFILDYPDISRASVKAAQSKQALGGDGPRARRRSRFSN
jgi:hypothetical protein